MMEPILEGKRGHMRTELGDQNFAEILVFAVTEKLPHIGIAQCSESSDFKLQKMILIWTEKYSVNTLPLRVLIVNSLEINCVESLWPLQGKRENIIACTSNGQDNIIWLHLE